MKKYSLFAIQSVHRLQLESLPVATKGDVLVAIRIVAQLQLPSYKLNVRQMHVGQTTGSITQIQPSK
jgi:hypothetical protein